jgi:hypothetical protein
MLLEVVVHSKYLNIISEPCICVDDESFVPGYERNLHE